jgi:hypothetical protein
MLMMYVVGLHLILAKRPRSDVGGLQKELVQWAMELHTFLCSGTWQKLKGQCGCCSYLGNEPAIDNDIH